MPLPRRGRSGPPPLLRLRRSRFPQVPRRIDRSRTRVLPVEQRSRRCIGQTHARRRSPRLSCRRTGSAWGPPFRDPLPPGAILTPITRSRTGQMQIKTRSELEQLSNALLEPLFPVARGVRLLGVSLSSLAEQSAGEPEFSLPV